MMDEHPPPIGADEPVTPPESSTPEEPAAEGPPRGVHTMALFRWALIASMALVAALSVAYSFGFLGSALATAAQTQYQCPMHPQVIQDHPGECPICSMTLVPIQTGKKPGASSTPKAATPSGDHAGHRHNPTDPYLCPMHPEETGTSAEARCPICEMKLVPRPPAKSAAATPSTTAPPAAAEGVPGLVPVELGLDRVQLIGVRTAVATRSELLPELRTVGFVTANESKVARVHTRFSGWIERLAVATTGQKVKRGELLASIYNVELLPAQQEFLSARRWNARSTSAPAPSSKSAELMAPLEQDARTRLELLGMSSAEIDRIAETGKPTRSVAVSSPLTGHVMRKSVAQGTYVQPGTELFEIADLSKLWVLADVYEYEAPRVRVGQAAEVELSASPGQRVTGKVGLIYPTVDADTRTLRVRIELDNEDMRLRPGMYANVLLRLGAAEGVVIPSEALVDTGDHQYVFIAKEGGRFEPRRVRAGARTGERTQILEGVAAGDVVVTTANFLLDSESRLRAAIEGSAPSAP